MAGEISMSLGNFHFRRPVWQVGKPKGSYEAREKEVDTDSGWWHFAGPMKAPKWVIPVVYWPEGTPRTGDSFTTVDPVSGDTITIPGTRKPWNEDVGNYRGIDSLLALRGTYQDFLWGDRNFGMFYVQKIDINSGWALPNKNTDPNSEQSDVPTSIDVIIYLTGKHDDEEE